MLKKTMREVKTRMGSFNRRGNLKLATENEKEGVKKAHGQKGCPQEVKNQQECRAPNSHWCKAPRAGAQLGT